MQLKKEVKELTLQRDLAESRINEMMRVHDGDVVSTIDMLQVVSIYALPKAVKVATHIPFLNLTIFPVKSPGKFGYSIPKFTCEKFMEH